MKLRRVVNWFFSSYPAWAMRLVFLIIICVVCVGIQPLRADIYSAYYEKAFVGLTRDQITIRYGGPSRTVRLSDNRRMMEYHARRRVTSYDAPPHSESCTLRLWYANNRPDPIIDKADYLGFPDTCDYFLNFHQ